MRNSEKVSNQFIKIVNYLECAQQELGKLPVEFADQSVALEIFNRLGDLAAQVEDFQYETCAPMEMDEDERDEEIRVLERRLAELKAKQ